MFKLFRIPLVLCLFGLIAVTSCKKENLTESNTRLLTAHGAWYLRAELLASGTYNCNGVNTNDVFVCTPACQADNRYDFLDDSVYSVKDGSVKCNINHPEEINRGKWWFQDGETRVKIVDYYYIKAYDVVMLTEDTLKLYMPYLNPPRTYVYSH